MQSHGVLMVHLSPVEGIVLKGENIGPLCYPDKIVTSHKNLGHCVEHFWHEA